jgi:riboflavin biosynthesis pyrimidine reductase
VALPETLDLVYHASEPYPRRVPLDAVYRDLPSPPRSGRPFVRVNMVQTIDGAVAIDGTAWTIGSEVDHYLFRTLRGWADAILTGAGTLRQNDVIATTHPHLQAQRLAGGRPANPMGVIITRDAAFSDAVLAKRFFTRGDFASLVLTADGTPEDGRRRVERAGAEVCLVPAGSSGEVDVNAALTLLAKRGVVRLLAEGGPGLNRRLVEAGFVDELFLTVTPAVSGVPDPPRVLAGMFGGAQARLSLISEFHYRDPSVREWYFRFAVDTGRP